MLIYSFGDYEFDGVYVYSEDNNYYYGGDFIRVDDLLWSNREPNTNEFSFGFQASILKVWSPCQWLQFLAPLVTLLMLFPMKEWRS